MLKHFSILLILAIVLIGGFFVFQVVPKAVKSNQGVMRLGDKAEFKVDIVDNPISRAQGLSGRESLKDDEGMLFVFEQSGMYGFWMKDMNFPIDIVWISKGEVVGVASDLPPDDDEDRIVYYPPVMVDRVLEIKSGAADKFMIRKGDEAEIEI